ncbi:sphingomyelin phosphodiesterase 4, neutral membrane (neutral sphingomyelinase-3) [Kappamyces sp. JEL0680]|nr:sphingomyelin phosphodiesterase 4, neutral membrane (neutral sphingomyelinase-3) [Kappamyces sp. JEL0680]
MDPATGGFRDLAYVCSPSCGVEERKSRLSAVLASINAFLQGSDAAVVRPLLAHLPESLALLYGAKDGNIKKGLLHLELSANEGRVLRDFLGPASMLPLKLLALQSDTDAQYTVNSEHLPASVQKTLSSGDYSQLAFMFKKNMTTLSSGLQPSATGINAPTPSTSTAFAGSSTQKSHDPMTAISAMPSAPSPRIMFNMFEYYMYTFALCATLVVDRGTDVAATSARSPKLPAGAGGYGSSVVPSFLDKIYHTDLLQAYLDFFLPQRPIATAPSVAKSAAASSPSMMQTPSRPSYSHRTSIVPLATKASPAPVPAQKLDNCCIFKCTAVESLSTAVSSAQFAIEALIETWLGQNVYEGAPLTGSELQGSLYAVKSGSYAKPSSYQLLCISRLINHLLGLDLSSISTEQISRLVCDRQGGHMETVYDINKANAYKAFGVKFYRYICTALTHWPRDDSVKQIVYQWIGYAFPWRKRGGGYYSDEWAVFVADNFLFYTRVLQLFFQRAVTFDFYSSTRPVAQKKPAPNGPYSTAKESKTGYMDIVELVLDHFQDDRLLELLRALETALLSLKTHQTGSQGMGISSPVMKTTTSTAKLPTATASRAAREGKMDVTYQYRNSGPKTKLHITTFEGGRFYYSPLFETADAMGQLPSRLITVLTDAKERLSHFKTISTRHPTPKQEDSSLLMSILSYARGDSISTASTLSSDSLAVLDKNVHRLASASDVIAHIWSLENLAQDGNHVLRRTQSDLVGLLHDDTEEEPVEGVAEPQRATDVGNVLTLRGRHQVKLGLRKSASEGVPLIASQRAKSIIKSTEIGILVSFFDLIARAFDKSYPALLALSPLRDLTLPDFLRSQFPERPGLHWLRMFASYDTLLVSLFVYYLLRTWFLMGLLVGLVYAVSPYVDIKVKTRH